ncbi:hypothetical protein PENTCL1PPCAC_21734, partial [Pristionchus entomophagus]
EEPYVAVVYSDYLHLVCSGCFHEDTILLIRNCKENPPKACRGCHKVYYCGAQCQKNDWKLHKAECKFLSAASEVPLDLVRMIARLLIRRQRGDHDNFTAFNGRTFDDLMDHRSEFDSLDANNRFDTVFEDTKNYVTSDYMVDKEEILRYAGKILVNQFAISGPADTSIGNGLYIGCSVFDHSCQPDLTRRSIGSKIILRTQNKDQTLDGIDKLTVSYISSLSCTEEWRKLLRSNPYFFHCECRKCEDTEQDGYARSIKCTNPSCVDGLCIVKYDSTSLSCIKCAATSNVTVEEAHNWNADLIRVEDSGIEEVEVLTDLYNNMAPKLSRRNIHLANLSFRLCTLHKEESEFVVAAKYAQACEEALMSLTTLGMAERTATLEVLTQVAFLTEETSPNTLRLLAMWERAVLASNGPEDVAKETRDEATLEMYFKIKFILKDCETAIEKAQADSDEYETDDEEEN